MVNPDIFNDVPLFALLDADERQVLAQQVSARHFGQGETNFKAVNCSDAWAGSSNG